MKIRDVMTSDVETCRPETDLALEAMRRHKVRQLPVIDSKSTVKGVIWLNDIVLASEQGVGPDPKQIVSTLAAICVHRAFTPDTPAAA